MTPIELVEKWSEEINIKNISWHELSLLKSFASWMMQSGLTPRALDAATTSENSDDAISKNIAWRDGFTNPPPRR